jgi:hypothetical protein
LAQVSVVQTEPVVPLEPLLEPAVVVPVLPPVLPAVLPDEVLPDELLLVGLQPWQVWASG